MVDLRCKIYRTSYTGIAHSSSACLGLVVVSLDEAMAEQGNAAQDPWYKIKYIILLCAHISLGPKCLYHTTVQQAIPYSKSPTRQTIVDFLFNL